MTDGNTLTVPAEMQAAARIRLARIAAGLSRKEAARALGLSLRTYDRVEAGERELTLGEAGRLAQLTGQDHAFFFGASLDEEGDGAGVLPPALPSVNNDSEPRD
jgi:transcriptional regulator with XRE-family HTH domain